MVPTQQTHARQVKSNFDKCCMQIRNLHTANSAIVYFQYNYHHCQPASQPANQTAIEANKKIDTNKLHNIIQFPPSSCFLYGSPNYFSNSQRDHTHAQSQLHMCNCVHN